MGSFFGRGKNKDKGKDKAKEEEAEREELRPLPPVNRPSRRAVIPGAHRAGGAPGARPPTQRTGPAGEVPKPSVFAHGTRPNVTPQPPRPTESDNLELSVSTPERSESRGPMRAAGGPQFSGSLSGNARPSGPCRTGDAALLEFMTTKAALITAEQAELISAKALREQLALDAAAVQLGVVSEEQLVNALTQECWVPHLKVDKYEIRKKALDTVAKEDAIHYSVFPVDKLGSLLTLAMVNPLDQETIRVLESKTGLDIKRVVATRSEIQQGIEKYYSGQVVAKDTSISFVADAAQETKSMTQLLGSVKTSDPTPTKPTASLSDGNIVADIQDIDDLLSADEVIAPAIIEAKSIDDAPLVVPPGEVIEIAEPQIIESLALEVRPPAAPAYSFDEPAVAVPPASTPRSTQRITAPEFDLEDTDALAPEIKPATETRPVFPIPTPTTVAPRPPVAPPARAPAADSRIAQPHVGSVARPVTGVVRPATGSAERSGSSASRAGVGSSSSLFPSRTGSGRMANPKIVNLIPVLEEEFQHAITHGKAHVFEKWVGLQSRNRIINAVAVDSEFDELLAGLYAQSRRV